MREALAIAAGIAAYVAGLLWGVRIWTEHLDRSDSHSALPWVAAGVCGIAAWATVRLLAAP